MFCSKCGSELKSNADFCLTCGCSTSQTTTAKEIKKQEDEIKKVVGTVCCVIIGLFIAAISIWLAILAY